MKLGAILMILAAAVVIPQRASWPSRAVAADPSQGGEGVVFTPSSLPGNALQLPDGAFVPALVASKGNHVESNKSADYEFSDTTTFADLTVGADGGMQHLQTYDDLQRAGGWFQHATYGPMTYDYLGSTFASPAAATETLRDGLQASAFSKEPDNCGNAYQVSCYVGQNLWQIVDGKLMAVDPSATPTATPTGTPIPSQAPPPHANIIIQDMYEVLQVNQCLVEVRAVAEKGLFEHQRDQIVPTLNSMLHAGYVQAEQNCASPAPAPKLDFSIVQVRAEKMVTGAAYNLSHPGLGSSPVRRTVNLAVYFNVRNMFPDSHAIATFTVKRGYGVHFFFQSNALALPVSPNTYRITVPYIPRSKGSDYIDAQVAIDGVTREGGVTLHVTAASNTVAGQNKSSRKGSGSHGSSTFAPVRLSAFALPPSALPPKSQVRQHGVESNQATDSALVPHLGSQSLTALGRQTGYYLDTLQPNHGHAVATQYLVSVFDTPAQANAALDQQRAGYSRLAQAMPGHYTSPTSRLGVGDAEGFGTSLILVSGKPFYSREQYFVRGRIFVQVVQSYFVRDSKPYGATDRAYLHSITRLLDARARTAQ